jgi:hypothetical protein
MKLAYWFWIVVIYAGMLAFGRDQFLENPSMLDWAVFMLLDAGAAALGPCVFLLADSMKAGVARENSVI